MKTNNKGLKLIKEFEGCSLKAYKLKGESYYTIGYGHSFDNSINASTVWSQKKADEMLEKDLAVFERYVERYASAYHFSFNSNQFSALVSYAYNRGNGGLNQLLKNSKTISDVSKNIVVYWGGAVLYKNGLIRRRKAEQALFNTPDNNQAPSKPAPQASPSYFRKYTGKSVSIVDALQAIGAKSDMSYRKKIAAKNNIGGYKGSALQNLKLLKLLKQGKLLKP